MFKLNKTTTRTFLAAGLLAVGANAAAKNHDFGLGIVVGEPTGITGKKFLDDNRAVDFALAWSFEGNDSVQAHANYLFHQGQLPVNADTHGSLPWYWGVGARIKLEENEGNSSRNNDDDLIGVRVPVGVAWYPENTQLEVFGEIAPTLDLAPDSDFDIGAGIGARYYF